MEKDSSLIRALIECDSLGRARIRELIELRSGKHVSPPSIAINQDNVLTATAAVDSFSVYAQIKDRYEERKTTIETKEIVEVNRLTEWQEFRLKMGTVCCLILAGLILFKLIKLSKKII